MSFFHHKTSEVDRPSRRRFLQQASAGALAAGTLSLHDLMALNADELQKQGRSVILLFMQGGPSHLETFDPKPDAESTGSIGAIDTSTPGIQIAEGWERTAQVMDDIALIRSMTNEEGNHQRAVYQMHTGYAPAGSVRHPGFGSVIANEVADRDSTLPSVVSVGPTTGAGFLGIDYEPFVVNRPGRLPDNVAGVVPEKRYDRRLGLLDRLEGEFSARGGKRVVNNHRKIYEQASRMVVSPAVKAFDISSEPASVRQRYGDSDFGRGCLMARRLVEQGVTFVEVVSRNWDHHQDIFENLATRRDEVDPAMAALIADLKDRGRLDKTLVLWLGEFGRTPRINARGGRDHYPRVFSAAAAGGGIRGGQVVGSSTDNASAVADQPVRINDLFCSVCHALQIDARKENISPLGRPVKIVDGGKVVKQLFS